MRLLDLYCGAGGAAMGYHQAGFDQIIGVDLKPQKNYPFDFIQADALSYLAVHGGDYDFIHASPPCQGYTILGHLALARGVSLAKRYPEIIPDLREALEETDSPYVIENVPRSPLVNPFLLCGVTFGLRVLRHRAFESSQFILAPTHSKHRGTIFDRDYVGVYGTGSFTSKDGKSGWSYRSLQECSEAMGINWMTRREITQAVPPAYTRWIGEQIIRMEDRA